MSIAGYQGPDPEELVDRLLGAGRYRDLSVEQAAEIAHQIANHVQTVYCLLAGLEDQVRAIAAEGWPGVANAGGGTVYPMGGGSSRVLR